MAPGRGGTPGGAPDPDAPDAPSRAPPSRNPRRRHLMAHRGSELGNASPRPPVPAGAGRLHPGSVGRGVGGFRAGEGVVVAAAGRGVPGGGVRPGGVPRPRRRTRPDIPIAARERPLGLLCANGLIGLSYGWWVDKHNRHHAHPNRIGGDPDIAGAGIAFTPAQAQARRGGVGRWIARHQAGLFFPMLLLEVLDLHLSSGRALCRRRAARTRAWWAESCCWPVTSAGTSPRCSGFCRWGRRWRSSRCTRVCSHRARPLVRAFCGMVRP